MILPASKIKVVLVDGREFEGKLIGSDSKFDLAVIRIEADIDFQAIKVGNSVDLMIGTGEVERRRTARRTFRLTIAGLSSRQSRSQTSAPTPAIAAARY